MSFFEDLSRAVVAFRQHEAGYDAAVRRGRVWAVANQAGVASQAGLSATTPVLTLANPAGSNVRGKLWFAAAAAEVAFAAGAVIYLALGSFSATAVTGTLTTAQRNLGIAPSGAMSVIRCFLAATLPAAPVAIDVLGSVGTAAITAPNIMQPWARWYNGAVHLMPGCNLTIQTSTASGALGLWCSFIYEEEDL